MPEAALVAGALEEALRNHFGLEAFRPLQREIITEVLSGRPAVGILPTGGGKSLCYQLPALLLSGVTLVISPLISLMKDQVDALVVRGIAAVAINSQDTPAEGRRKLEALAAGYLKLAFIAPERLKSAAFLAACRQAEVSLLAVDEAHCVSQWGHDFRPDYRYIRDFHASIGSPPLLALTATARQAVREDVLAQLGIERARLFTASADRANLWLGLERCATVAEKKAKAVHLVRETAGSTIVYVTSRKDAESWAELLAAELREPVAAYHAGLSPGERAAVQNRFMAGLCRVVVATNAFGMGIDKPDIRAVIHAGVPDSLEAYFQEVGRAGRDGLPSACTMLLVPGMDVKIREYLLNKEENNASAEAVFRQIQSLAVRGGGLLRTGDEDDATALLVISHLQAMGVVELVQRGSEGFELRITGALTTAALGQLRARLQEHQAQRQERFRRMKNFVYLEADCRRSYLLGYFGESLAERPADCCSSCHPRPLPENLRLVTTSTKRTTSRTAQGSREAQGSRGSQRELPAEAHPLAGVIFEQLKQWRKEKAAEQQVPAYVVFGDRDLQGIAAIVPRTLDELAACRGLGPTKLERYGSEVLAQVARVLAAAPPELLAPAAEEKPARVPRAESVAAAGRYFAAGQEVAEVAQRLERTESTVWEYFLEWIASEPSDAWKQAVRRVISPDDYRVIRRELQAEPEGRLRPVFERLVGRYTYEQIRVARTVLQRAGG